MATPSAHSTNRRWPAEWEPHDATWLSWPHNEEDWPGKFGPIDWAFAEMVRLIAGRDEAPGSPGERVEVLCNTEEVLERARLCCTQAGAEMSRVRLHLCPTDRGWLRDIGPTFVRRDRQGRGLELIDWRFNAWAKYDNYALDDAVPSLIEAVTKLPRTEAHLAGGRGRFVMEGGAIETDGAGLMLVTDECLMDQRTQARNPGLSRQDYERAFAEYLGITRTVWLGKGCVGDDTHGHIDDIARFAPPIGGKPVVILAYEDNPDDENHESSLDNERRLGEAGLHVVTIPYPAPVMFDGQRLPASYANFYIANSAVVVPTFNDANDRVALNTIAALFPDRPTIGLHALDLVWGLGTVHCLTQQQPRA